MNEVPKLTKEQAIIIMGFTQYTTINFYVFHQDVEKRLGRPVMSGEFALLADTIKELYREDFLNLLGVEGLPND